jgi:hypothetical protein
MAFIRGRRTGNLEWDGQRLVEMIRSYQVIETYREGGKVRQRVLANLGPYRAVDEALIGLKEHVARCEERLAFCEEEARASWRARREWNYSIKMAEVELQRYRGKLARLEADISQHPEIRSVKDFTLETNCSDTAPDRAHPEICSVGDFVVDTNNSDTTPDRDVGCA